MTVMRSATLGFALALGAAGANSQSHAQTVISRQIENGLVETTVTRTPTGTVITRRPLAAAPPASTTYLDETVGAAPTTRTPAHHIVHKARRSTAERTAKHAVRTSRRVAAARPLELAPAQRRVIYRTLVQEQVVPQLVPQAVPVVPGYPPFPAPAYPARTVVVEPSATTGYAVSTPAETVDDDIYATQAAPAPVYAAPALVPAPVYAVGTVLPASVAVTPLPARAAVAVPSVRPYSYATVDGRVLLVDPATDAVVADITP
jgi:hypothetical protein